MGGKCNMQQEIMKDFEQKEKEREENRKANKRESKSEKRAIKNEKKLEKKAIKKEKKAEKKIEKSSKVKLHKLTERSGNINEFTVSAKESKKIQKEFNKYNIPYSIKKEGKSVRFFYQDKHTDMVTNRLGNIYNAKMNTHKSRGTNNNIRTNTGRIDLDRIMEFSKARSENNAQSMTRPINMPLPTAKNIGR